MRAMYVVGGKMRISATPVKVAALKSTHRMHHVGFFEQARAFSPSTLRKTVLQ
jgi:hypothetical protein